MKRLPAVASRSIRGSVAGKRASVPQKLHEETSFPQGADQGAGGGRARSPVAFVSNHQERWQCVAAVTGQFWAARQRSASAAARTGLDVSTANDLRSEERSEDDGVAEHPEKSRGAAGARNRGRPTRSPVDVPCQPSRLPLVP
jgi:hypothetical protein